MNNDEKIEPIKQETQKSGIMHYILTGDYIIFLFAFILGVILDLIYVNKILINNYTEYSGLFFAIMGPILIYWAQSTSAKLAKNPPSEPTFTNGPYKYLANPTHTGLIITMFGCALMIHSVFSLILLVIANIISRRVILKKQDKILLDRYGKHFKEYKKEVKKLI